MKKNNSKGGLKGIFGSKSPKNVMEKPMEIVSMMKSEQSDPNGSYTGIPNNEFEKPIQDADDL